MTDTDSASSIGEAVAVPFCEECGQCLIYDKHELGFHYDMQMYARMVADSYAPSWLPSVGNMQFSWRDKLKIPAQNTPERYTSYMGAEMFSVEEFMERTSNWVYIRRWACAWYGVPSGKSRVGSVIRDPMNHDLAVKLRTALVFIHATEYARRLVERLRAQRESLGPVYRDEVKKFYQALLAAIRKEGTDQRVAVADSRASSLGTPHGTIYSKFKGQDKYTVVLDRVSKSSVWAHMAYDNINHRYGLVQWTQPIAGTEEVEIAMDIKRVTRSAAPLSL